jgi:hypothetical protein
MLKKADKEIFIECEFITIDLFAMAEHLLTVAKSSSIPRSNMHDCKRPFTEENGDI